jgi:hypothetical protein
MADDRLIELAIKGLEVEKARIEAELADLRKQRDGRAMKAAAPSTRGGTRLKAGARKRRGLTPEGRKRLSELARQRWVKSRKLGKSTL